MRLNTVGDFGLMLRRIRKSNRMTQRQLAERVGTSQEWISNLETGRVENPSLLIILRAFHVLGLQLYVEAGNPNSLVRERPRDELL
jgi:HTH-type transcriptional regulator/antitoxin HipB